MSDKPAHTLSLDTDAHATGELSLVPHGGSDGGHDGASEAAVAAFAWPAPPFPAYAPPQASQEPEVCEIVGLNGRLMQGRIHFFVPAERVAHIQVPPARTTMPLRFNQFRTLRLSRPLLPHPEDKRLGGPGSGAAEGAEYRVHLVAGGMLEGCTIGHVDNELGLFLFPPVDDTGAVQRLFVPREAVTALEFGPFVSLELEDADLGEPSRAAPLIDAPAETAQQRLGEILLTQSVTSSEQLLVAIEQQSKMPMVRIGEALVALGLITEEQLAEALRQQQTDRTVPIGELLVRLGLVSRQDLMSALARKMGYPLVDLEKFAPDPDALQKVPFSVAARLRVLPLMLRDTSVIVALEDPSKRAVLSELEFVTQCKIVPVLAHQSQLEWAIRDAYTKLGADVTSVMFTASEPDPVEMDPLEAGKLVEDLEKEGLDKSFQEEDRPIEQSDNSLVRLINTMIIEAYTQGVSDIHIESYPGREKIKIRFRKDGGLVPYLELPHNYRSAMIARIKIMCDLDISERRKPQDGKINFARFVPQYRLELRVATIPTNHGLEDVVMRILSSAKPMPLDKIGLSEGNYQRLTGALQRPYGMILCVGPTGSGKTTTLHSALSYINVPERKIWTAEDPVEITQAGLRQVQVNNKIDWTFAKALRSFLRADPDVIMVGEMRDQETASVGVEASLTGHLVLSTLHTNSAPETVTRLLDMGMDPFNFADSLLAVLAQRLVKRLCTACRVAQPATEEEIELLLAEYSHIFAPEDRAAVQTSLRAEWTTRFGQDGQLMSYHSPGCPHCSKTGYKGRAGLHELLTASPELKRLIQTGARAEEIQHQALREGMRTLRQDGIEKVLSGVTSMEEVRATSNM